MARPRQTGQDPAKQMSIQDRAQSKNGTLPYHSGDDSNCSSTSLYTIYALGLDCALYYAYHFIFLKRYCVSIFTACSEKDLNLDLNLFALARTLVFLQFYAARPESRVNRAGWM